MSKPTCTHHIHVEDGIFPLLLGTPVCIHCGLVDWDREHERCQSVTCPDRSGWRVRPGASRRKSKTSAAG
jgi:hypothetical protein